MQLDNHSSLIEIMENCRVRRYSGAVNLSASDVHLGMWFVRGSLAHAQNSSGETGWMALESLKSEATLQRDDAPGDLPPQRTIRVDTARLIRAMKSSQGTRRAPVMDVPVPVHARLQSKFQELKHRIAGLKGFESSSIPLVKDEQFSLDATTKQNATARTIVEKDPRGAKWTHLLGERQLVVLGDENITTSDLLWAGTELWKELDRLNKNNLEHE